MSSSNLVRWSGLAALLGGGLFVLLNILEALLFGNQASAEVAGTSAWIIVQGFYIVAAVLITLGLVGFYVCQVEQAGMLGLVAFVVAFFGGMMIAGAVWSETFFGTWLAEVAPQLLDTDPTGALAAGLLITYLLFAIGWLLFGLASLRAGVLLRTGMLLLIIGAVLFPLLGALEVPFSGVLFGAAVAWMGYTLWSGAGDAALITEGVT